MNLARIFSWQIWVALPEFHLLLIKIRPKNPIQITSKKNLVNSQKWKKKKNRNSRLSLEFPLFLMNLNKCRLKRKCWQHFKSFASLNGVQLNAKKKLNSGFEWILSQNSIFVQCFVRSKFGPNSETDCNLRSKTYV